MVNHSVPLTTIQRPTTRLESSDSTVETGDSRSTNTEPAVGDGVSTDGAGKGGGGNIGAVAGVIVVLLVVGVAISILVVVILLIYRRHR